MDLATANLSMYPGAPQSMAQDASADTLAKTNADKASTDKSKSTKTAPTTPVPSPPAAAPTAYTAPTQYGQGVDQNALGANKQYGQPAQ